MNFLSHYFNSKHNLPYYNLGVILPDLYPNFSFYHNKYFVNFKDLNILSTNELLLWEGIEQHYLDDSIFHALPEFDKFISEAMIYFNSNSILKHIKRKNFLGHILFEIILDHQLLIHNEMIIKQFYTDLETIDENIVYQFFSKIIPLTDKNYLFLKNFDNFKIKKYLEFYKIEENLLIVLHKITGKISQWELSPEINIEILNFIKNYKLTNNYKDVFTALENEKHDKQKE